jgi:putative peptide zinc metalloprotease protein
MTTDLAPANSHHRGAVDQRTVSDVPCLVEGVQLLGVYEGSGYQESRYLVRRADEQTLLMTRLPYLVLRHVDGRRDLRQVAELVTAEHGQRLGPEEVRYLIDTKLAPLGLVASGHVAGPPPKANPLLALHVRCSVIPPHVVRVVARVLAPLHAPALLGAFLAGLIAVDWWMLASGHADGAIRQTVADPVLLLVMIALCLSSLVFHEFGHASACHYGGAQPGAIGAGLYLLFPCFYTNVTDAYRLNRAGRLRTDFGGVYFNAIFIVVLGLGYIATGYPPLLAAAILGHIEIIQQLPPLVRFDGYYILADLVGVPNLFGQVRPILRSLARRGDPRNTEISLRPRVRRIVTAWVLLVVPLLVAGLVVTIVQMPSYATSAWNSAMNYGDIGAQAFLRRDFGWTLLALVSMAMLALPWLGMAAVLVQAVKRAVALVARRAYRAAANRVA